MDTPLSETPDERAARIAAVEHEQQRLIALELERLALEARWLEQQQKDVA